MTPEERQKIRDVATRAEKEIIRSHGWEESVESLDTLQIDEDYLKAVSPSAILTLLDQMDELQKLAESVCFCDCQRIMGLSEFEEHLKNPPQLDWDEKP